MSVWIYTTRFPEDSWSDRWFHCWVYNRHKYNGKEGLTSAMVICFQKHVLSSLSSVCYAMIIRSGKVSISLLCSDSEFLLSNLYKCLPGSDSVASIFRHHIFLFLKWCAKCAKMAKDLHFIWTAIYPSFHRPAPGTSILSMQYPQIDPPWKSFRLIFHVMCFFSLLAFSLRWAWSFHDVSHPQNALPVKTVIL